VSCNGAKRLNFVDQNSTVNFSSRKSLNYRRAIKKHHQDGINLNFFACNQEIFHENSESVGRNPILSVEHGVVLLERGPNEEHSQAVLAGDGVRSEEQNH
jgi:hypothetical protein